MGRPVGGVRDRFYRDLTEDYLERKTRSSLYRFFWRESMEALLKESLPRLLAQKPVPGKHFSELLERDFPDFPWQEASPENSAEIIEQLSREMKKHPLEARLLLESQDEQKRWGFWEKLQLNNAGYQAGLITDTAYYLWLIEYLAAHGAYYKETIKDAGGNGKNLNGHRWLLPLLHEAPPRLDEKTGKPIAPGWKRREKDKTFVFAVAQVERDLRRMAALIREERSAGRTDISGRLHDLKIIIPTGEGGKRTAEYLPWLTGRLERTALHITIKNWLQYSGYPLVVYDEMERRREKKRERERKSDFSMRVFEAFCDSPEGYRFQRKKPGDAESWQMDGNGFCLLAPDQIEPLLESLRRSGKAYFYLPLAVDLYSGCTFFLAGKENYEEAYESAGKEAREAYKKSKEPFCFDYLRLERYPLTLGGAFRLGPTFHENAGKDFQTVLNAFKRYCMTERSGPRQTLQRLNEDEPAGLPTPFRGAFE